MKKEELTALLYELRDDENAKFQVKLTPGLSYEDTLGVRLPELRSLAKRLIKESNYHAGGDDVINEFLMNLPHKYHDENLLHAIIISADKDYVTSIKHLYGFLPFVSNWMVCDTIKPTVLRKNKEDLMKQIIRWTSDDYLYTQRFGIRMLMEFFLDDDFSPQHLYIPASIVSDEYYLHMMNAWYYSVALIKQWDAAVDFLRENTLDKWTHNKSIQKARESRRISDEKKDFLNSLKRN